MREYKVISGEEVKSQHRLLCAVLRTKEAKHRGTSREKDTNAEESWKLLKKFVMRAAKELCGGKHLERDTWWWSEEVQENLRMKWQMQGGNELKEDYKNLKR